MQERGLGTRDIGTKLGICYDTLAYREGWPRGNVLRDPGLALEQRFGLGTDLAEHPQEHGDSRLPLRITD